MKLEPFPPPDNSDDDNWYDEDVIKEENRFFWVRGVITFIVTMAALVTGGALLQMNYGIYGVLYTEILLLAVAVGAAMVMRLSLRDILQVKMPRVSQLFGVVIMALSGLLVASAGTIVTFLIYPEAAEVTEVIVSLYDNVPFLVAWLIIAVSPAVCEEVLHRGVIMHTFTRSGMGKWPLILSMGLIFGIFHLDPARFVTTTILGIIITYIMVETGNFLLPVLYHLLNNTLSVVAGFSSQAEAGELAASMDMLSDTMLITIGTLLIMLAIGAPLLYLGAWLIRTKPAPQIEDSFTLYDEEAPKPRRRPVIAIIITASVVLLIAGFALIMIEVWQSGMMDEILAGMDI